MRTLITMLLGFLCVTAADAAIIVYNGVSTNHYTGLGRQWSVVFRSYTARDISSGAFRAVTWGRVDGQKVFFVESPDSVFRDTVVGRSNAVHTFVYQSVQTTNANGSIQSFSFARGRNVPLDIGLGLTFDAPRISEGVVRSVQTVASGNIIGQGKTIASFNSTQTKNANERPDSVDTFVLRVIESLLEQGYSRVTQ